MTCPRLPACPCSYTGGATKNGGMITSCICHGCPWPALQLDGKNSYQHYADWYYDKTTGAASMHIDPRLPNGGGTFVGPAFKSCSFFPNQTAVALLVEDRALYMLS